MVTVLDRKLIRDLWTSKGLLLLIASIIAIGITCFVAMRSAFHNLSYAKQEYYRRCRMADFWIDVRRVPVSEVVPLASLAGIRELHSRIQFPVTVDLAGVIEPMNGLVISLPDRRRPVLNDIVLRRGDYFSPRRPNEVIVNERFAEEHRLRPGDSLHLLLNNRREELFIVGTAISSEFTYLVGPGTFIPDPAQFGVFYVKQTFAEGVFDFRGAANSITGTLTPDSVDRVDQVMKQLEIRLDPFGVAATTPLELQASNQFLSNEISGLGTMASVLSTVFLTVAATVLNVLINRLARRQRTTIGTLKALGYSDSTVFRHFLWYGLAVGLVGSLLGSAAGYASSTGMTEVYSWFFQFPDLHSGFYWYTHVVGLAVSMACAVAGSWHGAWQMLRLRPAEAMRPTPPKRGRRIWLESWMGGAWQALDWSWRSVIRGLVRNRLRTASSVFAAAMGAGLLVNGFMMTEGQSFFVQFQFHRVTRSDIDVNFKNEQGQEALAELRQFPGVTEVEPLFSLACTLVHGPFQRKSTITGLEPAARLTVPHDVQHRPISVPSSGIVLSQRLADKLHVRVGDQVTVVPVRGERRPVQVTVSKIADTFMGLAAYANIHYLSRSVGESLVMNGAQLVTDRSASQTAELYQRLKRLPEIESVQVRQRIVDTIRRTLLQNQYVFIALLIGFSGMLMFGSAVNAAMVNFAERESEVATLRAIGYGSWRVGSLFFHENMLLTVVGTLLGLPVGYALTWLLAYSYDNDLLRLPVVTAPWVWFGTVGLAALFAAASQLVVQRTIGQLDLANSLKVKE